MPDMITLSVKCYICGKEQLIEVSKEGYEKWKAGALIQEALPSLSPDKRELLISNTCPACWDKLFG